MSFFGIIDCLDDRNSETINNHFKRHCEWCWYHGYGNCKNCERAYRKVYTPVRKKELREKLGLIKSSQN